MVQVESDRLAGRKVLIIGTEFTANQDLYVDVLAAAASGVRVQTVAATELERNIARLQPWDGEGGSALNDDLRQAIAGADIAVLACTCFPIARDRLESLFPGVQFLDPGAYCSGLLQGGEGARDRKLQIKVTGDVVSRKRATDFARTYLGSDYIVSP